MTRMTREAIRRLKNILSHAVHTIGEETFTMSLDDGIAVKMAIKSLEAWELVKKEIEDIDVFGDELSSGELLAYAECLRIINKHLEEVQDEK